MDFDSIASELAQDHGLKPASKTGGTLDDIAATLAKDHDIKFEPVVEKKGRLYITPRAPISDVESPNNLAIDPNIKTPDTTGSNTRSISDVPIKAGEAALDAVKSGAAQGKEGLTEVFSGKPASGLGKIGTGALTIAGAPAEAVSSAAADLTGSKDIGDRASLVAGGLPVAKAGAAAISAIPGIDKLSNIPVVSNFVPIALPKSKAINELVSKITSNGRDYQALSDTIQAMKADPRIGPADTSPAVQNMTQKLFTTEGDAAKNYLHNTSKDRVANLPQDVKSAFDSAGGVPVNVVQKLADLGNASKQVGNNLINPAIKGAKPVDISPVVEHIENILKPGVMQKITGESTLPFPKVKQALANVKSMIASKSEWLSSPQDLHDFQSALRKEAEARLSSGDGSERQLGHALMQVRSKLVDAIDEASPKANGSGSYKPALSAYRDEKNIADAFKEGYQNSAKGMEKDPEFTKQWFNNLTDNEKEAAREGKRLSIAHKMDQSNNPSLAGTNLARSEFNKKELEIFFGKEGTEKLLRDLENTRAIKNTDQKIIEGSQTEMRRAGDEAIALPEKGKSGSLLSYALPVAAEYAGQMLSGTPGIGALLGGATVAAKAIGSAAKHSIATALAKERNLHLAKMALPVEGPSRDQLIKELEARIPGPKQSIMTRVANRLPISP